MKARDLSAHEVLLLKAALHPDPAIAVTSWQRWCSQVALEEAPHPDLRLLPAIYAHLSSIAPNLELSTKLRGKARANFTRNTLLSHASLALIEELDRHCPVMLMKGLAICIRFDAWSSRSMADIDVFTPFEVLETACRVLGRAGWTPDYGMTVPSLLHRSSLRRDSWNFSKGPVSLDLHWRLRDVPAADWLARQMWTSAERAEFCGAHLLLQSPEFAFASSLHHGFSLSSRADALQTVVDTAWLLPLCEAMRLRRLLRKAELLAQLDELTSIFETVGLAQGVASRLATPSRRSVGIMRESRSSRIAASIRAPFSRKIRTEVAVLRRPLVYRLWYRFGKSRAVERLLLRLGGPLSRPLSPPQAPAPDYDLCDCKVIDALAGPGWTWPQPDHSCFWADRSDARLLIPLGGIDDHLLALSFSEQRHQGPNLRIDVFANGSYIATIDFRDGVADSDRCLLIPKRVLFGPWVELSLRPKPYRGDRVRSPEGYALRQSLPVRRLRVLDRKRLPGLFSVERAPELYSRILNGEEPYRSKWARIKAKMETSPHRTAPGLPPDFDPVRYALFYPDLFEQEVDPYAHFLTHGRQENRAWR